MRNIFLFLTFMFTHLFLQAQNERSLTHQPRKKNKLKSIPKTINSIHNINIIFEEFKNETHISLINFDTGKITHVDLDTYIDTIVSFIQLLRKKKEIKDIILVGWADGTRNIGIDSKKINPCIECRYLVKKRKIFDPTLAKLRACIVEKRIKNIITGRHYSINSKDEPDFYDVPDGESDGKKRKVILTIKFKSSL